MSRFVELTHENGSQLSVNVDLVVSFAPLGGAFGVRAYVGQDDPETWLAEADAAMWVRKRGAR